MSTTAHRADRRRPRTPVALALGACATFLVAAATSVPTMPAEAAVPPPPAPRSVPQGPGPACVPPLAGPYQPSSTVLTDAANECDAARVLDGFAITRLPDGIGPLVSDFAYEWEDVAHRSRVWERGPDDDGAYQVDLTVKVMRGEPLGDLESLRLYLAEYHERDPDEWDLEEFTHRGKRGYRSATQAFWLESPGVAVGVSVDGVRFTGSDLMLAVRGVHPAS